MQEFKVGDVVMLKSGGPDMTIVMIFDNGNAECWWSRNVSAAMASDAVNKYTFPLACLVPAPAKPQDAGPQRCD